MNKKLEELFEKWKEEHKRDILYEYDTPQIYGKLIPRENFISDGFCVCEEIKDNTILYISKESHEYNQDSDLNEMKQHEYTWLKYCISEKKNGMFFRRIKMMQEELGENMENLSFMNINKRGGFEKTDMVVLNTYAMNFSNNILKEIEIINPKIIVCCGIGLERMIKMIYKKCNKEIDKDIIEVHHPSFVTSDEKYIYEFKKQLKAKI